MKKILLVGVFLWSVVFNVQGFKNGDSQIGHRLSQIHCSLVSDNVITPDDFAWLQKIVFEENDKVAHANLTTALGLLGRCCLKQKEYQNFHTCIGSVSQLSDEAAKCALTYMVEQGKSDDFALFSQLWLEQLRESNVDALCSMAIFKYYGILVSKDRQEAIKVLRILVNRARTIPPIAVTMLAKQGLAR